jgi:hypothetical protein
MKSSRNHINDDFDDYEPYEEKKGRIKRVDSDQHKRREIRNWSKAWNDHTGDADDIDDFYAKPVPRR